MRKGLVSAALVALTTLSLTSCGYSIPSDMVAIHIGEGPLEARKIKGEGDDRCLQPATRGWWTNDTYYKVPTNEREWDASANDDADGGRFEVTTKDNVVMYVPVNIRFTIDTECEVLVEFYQKYLRRYGVEFEDDGGYNEEWISVLRRLVADPAEQELNALTQEYGWRDVWNDPDTKTALQNDLQSQLTAPDSAMTQAAKGVYFTGITVLVGKPKPQNKALAEAVAEEQTQVAQSKAAEAKAKADEATAKAEKAVAEAQAAKKRAEIAGYGSVQNYLYAQCIAEPTCGNPFRNQFLYGGNPN